MKILLTGKNGQVGFELRRSLALLGEVLAVDVGECDLCDHAAIRQVVRSFCPHVIVNPAAYTAVDQAERESALAQAINVAAPELLAQEAERLGAMMVFYSTDYVFDGNKEGSYTEVDLPAPQNVYGITKRAGECAVQNGCARHIILRTSWVVGVHGNNFAKTILKLATERDELRVVADQFGAPTSAALLADVTAYLLRQASCNPDSFPYGLYHAAAAGVTNWHEYACHLVNRARAAGRPMRLSAEAIRPVATADYPAPARRPANSRLDTAKLRDTFGLHLPDWQAGVDHILDQIL